MKALGKGGDQGRQVVHSDASGAAAGDSAILGVAVLVPHGCWEVASGCLKLSDAVRGSLAEDP